MSTDSKKNAIGFGCLIVFLLPFLLIGLGSLGKAIVTYIGNPVFTEEVIALFGVGGMFSLVGGAFVLLAIVGRKKLAEATRQKELYPDTPWTWQQDWAEGRIKSTTPITIFIFWLFGILFGGAGILILFRMGEITEESPMGYVFLLFPLIGLGMIIAAIYATLRWFKYGRVYCDLVTNPGVIGGWFQGIVWAKIDMAPGDILEAQLSCYHCYTSGSGDNRTTHRDVQWQESVLIAQERMMIETDGTLAMPIKVHIPRTCTPTTPGSPSDRIEWELSAKADVMGIDFSALFIVPVFVTDASSATPPDPLEAEATGLTPKPYTPSILITELAEGIELYAPPRRNPAMLLTITMFSFVWTIIFLGMTFFGSGIPILFPLVFGLFDLLILYAMAWMWLGKARIRIEHGSVYLSTAMGPIRSNHTFTVDEISDVDSRINMRSGNTPYYSISLSTPTGIKNTVGGIRNKNEVDDLVKRLKVALGG